MLESSVPFEPLQDRVAFHLILAGSRVLSSSLQNHEQANMADMKAGIHSCQTKPKTELSHFSVHLTHTRTLSHLKTKTEKWSSLEDSMTVIVSIERLWSQLSEPIVASLSFVPCLVFRVALSNINFFVCTKTNANTNSLRSGPVTRSRMQTTLRV